MRAAASMPSKEQHGYLVELTAPTPDDQPQQTLFAAAFADPDQAVAAVRKVMRGRRCAVRVSCRFSLRALAQLGVAPDEVVQLNS